MRWKLSFVSPPIETRPVVCVNGRVTMLITPAIAWVPKNRLCPPSSTSIRSTMWAGIVSSGGVVL